MAIPTEPGIRAPGGSGFDAIWWLASVIPYASSIGTPYACSARSSSAGDSAELHDRANRRLAGGPSPSARSRIIWCSVGPADSQVAPCSRAWVQNPRGVNRRGTITEPPPASAANVEATSPCTWNSGITQNDTSDGPSP